MKTRDQLAGELAELSLEELLDFARGVVASDLEIVDAHGAEPFYLDMHRALIDELARRTRPTLRPVPNLVGNA
jgi:hypothetical protein